MLIIANGAFKSGSTWQRNLIKDLADFQPLPEGFKDNRITSFINRENLAHIVTSSEIKTNHFIAKAHIFKESEIDLLLQNESDVKIFMIQRDLRDAIVSHFNHFINVRKFKPSFKLYYWLIGRYKAMQVIKYNKRWQGNHSNVFHSTFEALKADTAGELKKYANFLNLPVSQDKIDTIIEANSIKKVREKSDRKWFFRKGQIGDYKNYMTPAILKDIQKLEKKSNVFDTIIFYILFELRYTLIPK
jgi:hypothetical protein